MKLSCISSLSTSLTGQSDMAEMAETLGVGALTNALTPGEQQTEPSLAAVQAL